MRSVPRDDAGGQPVAQPERVADGEDLVADRRRAAQHRGHDDLRQPVDGEHRDVVLRLARRSPARPPLVPSANSTWTCVGAVDDVQGREDRAVRVDDHAAAQTGVRVPASGRPAR